MVENRRRQLEACSRTLAPSPPPATPVRVQLRPPQTPRDASAYACGLRLQRKDESWVPPLHPSVAHQAQKRASASWPCAHCGCALTRTVANSVHLRARCRAGPVPCQCQCRASASAVPCRLFITHSARQCSDSTVSLSDRLKPKPLQVLPRLLWPVEIVRPPLA